MAVYAVMKYWSSPPKEIVILAFPDEETMEEAITIWHEERESRAANANLDHRIEMFQSSFAACTAPPPIYARPAVGEQRRLKHRDEHLVS